MTFVRIHGCGVQKYSNSPGWSKVYDQLSPGSLNEGSANALALETVAGAVRRAGVIVAAIEGLVDIPPFMPSRSDAAPDRWRGSVPSCRRLMVW
jgi:hypothetical protein